MLLGLMEVEDNGIQLKRTCIVLNHNGNMGQDSLKMH